MTTRGSWCRASSAAATESSEEASSTTTITQFGYVYVPEGTRRGSRNGKDRVSAAAGSRRVTGGAGTGNARGQLATCCGHDVSAFEN